MENQQKPPPFLDTGETLAFLMGQQKRKSYKNQDPTDPDDDYTNLDAYFVKEREPLIHMPDKKRDLNNVKRVMRTGLQNLGNTCYMNSTIQCLCYTSPLVTYFITDSYLRDFHRDNEDIVGGIVEEFAYLIKAMWSGKYYSIDPMYFKEVMGKYHQNFAGYEQQDTREFLMFLIDGLQEGLQKKVKDDIKRPLKKQKMSLIASPDHKKNNESILHELFQGHIKTTVKCPTCLQKTVNIEPFTFLYLPITKKDKNSDTTLNDCMEEFFAKKPLVNDGLQHISNCRKTSATIKKKIYKWPKILIIVLNRFAMERRRPTKIKDYVHFKQRMDISQFMSSPCTKTYELYAMSNHQGELNYGHYTACCKNPGDQKWYTFSDTNVYETRKSEFKTSAAYVLYYTSIDQQKYNPVAVQ